MAVVNPNNGPIDSSDANFAAFAACVAALGDARAIGYVYTKIAEETSPGVWEQRAFRDAGDVEADLDAWAASGLVEGVFLDEVSNSWAASSSGWADDATTAADHEAYESVPSLRFSEHRNRHGLHIRTCYSISDVTTQPTQWISHVQPPVHTQEQATSHACV